jgi:hypothetical protein
MRNVRRRLEPSAEGRWQIKAAGAEWKEMDSPQDSNDLEKAWKSGAPNHTITHNNDGRIPWFRRGDPYTLSYTADFRAGTFNCNEKPDRQKSLRRVENDVNLTPSQKKALDHAFQLGSKKTAHAKRYLELTLARISGVPEDWHATHALRDWVNEAPYIIHVNLTKTLGDGDLVIDKLLKDDRYRNLFETGDGGGSKNLEARNGWEVRVFGDAYKLGVTPGCERPKYGTVNLTNDPDGVKSARQYGKSVFVLKRHLRWRCTLTNKDTSFTDAVPGTVGQVFMFLDAFDEDELRLILEHDGKHALRQYPEIQIHGQVLFNRDIERLVADSNSCAVIQERVQKFCEKNGIKLEWRSM